MGSEPSLISFATRDAMAARVSDFVAASLRCAAAGGRPAEFAVSGGSTPQALYENLAACPLPWPDIRLTLVDERWVSPDHPRSNEAFVRKAFDKADGVEIRGMYDANASLDDAASGLAAEIERRGAPFDVVLLGMGDDGHTASWFPHAAGLSQALEGRAPVCSVRAKKSAVTGDEVDRMTLSLAAVGSARTIILMIAGASKRAAFETAVEPGPIEEMPVRAILQARPDLWACWAP